MKKLLALILLSPLVCIGDEEKFIEHLTFILEDINIAEQEQDFSRAAARLSVAVEMGFDDKVYANSLADYYLDGRGVNQDSNEAIRLFKKAAMDSISNEGYGHAATTLGWIYFTGEYPNVDRDLIKAHRWNLLGSKLKHTNASANLALIYAGGFGVDPNINKTIDYFLESIEYYYPITGVDNETDDWKKYLPNPDPKFQEARDLYLQAINTGKKEFVDKLKQLKNK